MQLTIYTDYSLRLLIYLAANEKRSTILEISKFYKISANHLSKAVYNLVKLGYIISHQGRGGGLELAKRPSEINLRKVIQDCEPQMALVECLGKNNHCVITPHCHLKNIMISAKEAFLKETANFTLEDLVTHKNSSLKNMF